MGVLPMRSSVVGTAAGAVMTRELGCGGRRGNQFTVALRQARLRLLRSLYAQRKLIKHMRGRPMRKRQNGSGWRPGMRCRAKMRRHLPMQADEIQHCKLGAPSRSLASTPSPRRRPGQGCLRGLTAEKPWPGSSPGRRGKMGRRDAIAKRITCAPHRPPLSNFG